MTDYRGTLSIALLLLYGILQCIILELSRKERSFDGVRLVVAVEMLKLVISLPCSAVLDMKLHRVTLSWNKIKNTITNYAGWMLLPGFLFVLQNNLVFISASRLPASVVQVLYQVKLLWTALFSYCILGRRLKMPQWVALGVLMAGAALVQFDAASRASAVEPRGRSEGLVRVVQEGEAADASDVEGAQLVGSIRSEQDNRSPDLNPDWLVAAVGLVASLAASSLSGFNGVFLETMFKSKSKQQGQTDVGRPPADSKGESEQQTSIEMECTEPATVEAEAAEPVGIWTRNVQLSLYGILFGLAGLLYRDSSRVQPIAAQEHRGAGEGMRLAGTGMDTPARLVEPVLGALEGVASHAQGMSTVEWAFVVLLAAGGILVSLVTRYTSSMAKNMATTASTVVGIAAVQCIRGEWPSLVFVAGVAAVLGASLHYRTGGTASACGGSKLRLDGVKVVESDRAYTDCHESKEQESGEAEAAEDAPRHGSLGVGRRRASSRRKQKE